MPPCWMPPLIRFCLRHAAEIIAADFCRLPLFVSRRYAFTPLPPLPMPCAATLMRRFFFDCLSIDDTLATLPLVVLR